VISSRSFREKQPSALVWSEANGFISKEPFGEFMSQTTELTTNEEDQIIGIIGLIGTTQDQTNLFLALTWLSKKEMRGQRARAMLEEARNKTVRQVLQQARQEVGYEPGTTSPTS
jgi:hypothetical protein